VLNGTQRLGSAKGSEYVGHRLGDRRPVEVECQLLSLGALVRVGGRFARYTRSAERRDLVDGELLALAAPHRRSHRVDRLLGGPLRRARRDLAAIGSVVVVGDEVDVDGVAGTRERGVGPLVGEVLRPPDDHRPLNRRALTAVPGQRTGVLEMLGDVVGRQPANLAGVGLDGHRLRAEVDRADGAASAVVDVKLMVVAPRDHPVTDRHLETGNLDPCAQLTPGVAPCARLVVEPGPGPVVAHDHDRLLDSHLSHVSPPGGHGRLMGRLRADVVYHHLPALSLERKPPIRFAVVQLRQRDPLGGIALTDDGAELVSTQPL
jgi:hypothetical protein